MAAYRAGDYSTLNGIKHLRMTAKSSRQEWKPAIGEVVKAKNGAIGEIVNVIVLTPPHAHARASYAVVVKFFFDNRKSRFSADDLTPI
jgi:hypothetical protein